MALSVVVIVGWTAACNDTPTDPDVPFLATAIVSNAVQSHNATAQTTLPAAAYVSLPPGSIPSGQSIEIHNTRTGATTTAAMIDGGFDPVPIEASVDDVLDIAVSMSGGAEPLGFTAKVPRRRPPKVVRTSPPRGKRDVALNTTIIVVFSEPIDASTVSEAGIRVLHGTTPVPGRLELVDANGLTAAFTANAGLAPATTYEIGVTREIRDLEGEALEAAVVVPFTTEASTVPDQIVFTRYTSVEDGGNGGDLWLVKPDGSGVRRLTNSLTWGSEGADWSPDGSKLAFVSGRHGLVGDRSDKSIYVVEANGSGVRRLTQDWWSGGDFGPAWSPDGGRIAFSRSECLYFDTRSPERLCIGMSNPFIYVMNADGTNLRRLTAGFSPSWSPDGTRIVFVHYESGGAEGLYVMNDDGSGVTQLTDGPEADHGPRWSPDGQAIAFSRSPDGYTPADVFVINADGSGLRRLTASGGESPSWSPDGSRMAFVRFFQNGPRLFVMNADGTGVTDLGVPGLDPVWSPSGRLAPSRPAPAMSMGKAAENDGDAQADTVFATLAQPFRVQVYRDGIPASGVEVSWTVRSGTEGSTLSNNRAVTDATGIAATTLTLGQVARGYVVEASIAGAGGSPVYFGARALPGRIADLVLAEGSEQVGVRGTRLKNGYVVRVVDGYGNDHEDVPIEWKVILGGGQVISRYWNYAERILGPDLGPHAATATVVGVAEVPSVTFTAAAADAVVEVGTTDVGDCHTGFAPEQVTVPRGSTVGWGWILCYGDDDQNGAHHNVTFEDLAAVPVSSPTKRAGYHLRTFTAPGTYRYRCTLHSTGYASGEVGVVTVSP
jgi:TolB protein